MKTMIKHYLWLFGGFTIFLSCEAFYKPFDQKDFTAVTPTTIEELKKSLCAKFEKNKCVDNRKIKITINKVFDFTDYEGKKTEKGCFHKTKGNCKKTGQLKLNVAFQCDGLEPTDVTYSVAGRVGLDVGSNRVIEGINGGGLKGKGLRLRQSENVEIRNLKITDINSHVVWGGDAIDLINVKNVLIDQNYIARIGRQMIVTHFGSNKQVTISNNVFDGETLHSATCDGRHYWLWLFLGEADEITLQANVIHKTSGRGPHLVASKGSKTVVHMIQNIFTDISGHVIDLDDSKSSILVEGNTFDHVSHVIHKEKGNIFMVKNKNEETLCKKYVGRDCLPNTVKNSSGDKPKNSVKALEDIKTLNKQIVLPQNMKNWIEKLLNLPKKLLATLKSLSNKNKKT